MIATFLDTMQTLEAVISTTSMSSLPEEIQVDIFRKLPLKSISMSRCVCKLWRDLLSTSKFIRYHHNYNNIQNKNINHKLISLTRNYYSVYSTAYDSVSSSPLPSFNKAVKVNMVEVFGSCDGLICLAIDGSVISTNAWYHRIYIWNPLTREYKEVLVNSHFQLAQPNQGFGYDCIMDTYKLVQIGRTGQLRTSCLDIHVYTLGSNSWNITRQTEVPYFFPTDCPTTYGLLFNGALHWFGNKTANRMRTSDVIVSFDISTGRVGDVPLPAGGALVLSNGQGCKRNVLVLGDYLCLFNVGYDFGSPAEIWVMQKHGVQESWTKQYSITHPARGSIPYFNQYLRPLCVLENGELLISSGFTYDAKTKIFRELNVQATQMTLGIAQSYAESLVSPNSGTYAGKASE